jgi:hypothetical protein
MPVYAFFSQAVCFTGIYETYFCVERFYSLRMLFRSFEIRIIVAIKNGILKEILTQEKYVVLFINILSPH